MIGILLIVLTTAFSYWGFTNSSFFDKYSFDVDKILIHKEYKRLITSGFLHTDWVHLIFNMVSLYIFNDLLETQLGVFYFLIVYFTSLVGGNLLALYIHKQHADYIAVGASGAVSGIIFASIVLFPKIGIGFLGLPFSIPSWLYGILFIAYTIYGIKSNRDNIGHEAHLGGILTGTLAAIAMSPKALIVNYITILIILAPTLLFIYLIVTRPQLLVTNHSFIKVGKSYYDIDDKYNNDKVKNQQKLDKILDKITKKGIKSLSKKEKKQLEEYSKR